MPNPSLSALFGMPPERAAAYLAAKGLKLTGPYWELDGPEHSRLFTVAHLAKIDVLADIKGAVQQALDAGETERWFRKELEDTLRKKGWWGPAVEVDPDTLEAKIIQQGSYRRLQTIYRTNLQSAYMAGRHRQAMEQIARAPYAQYLAVRDSRTRPEHAALHGKVFRLDSPEWAIISPPNGYNCRCRARYLSQRELVRRDLNPADDVRILEREPPGRRPLDPATGVTPARWVQRGVSVPDPDGPAGSRKVLWADPGWDHLPGSDGAERELVDKLMAGAANAGAPLGSIIVSNQLAGIRALDLLNAEFAAWADRIVNARGEVMRIGSLSPGVVAAMAKEGIVPDSAILAVRDVDVLHTHRDTKTDALSWGWYRELPRHLTAPKAVLLDKTDPKGALLMVFDVAAQTGKLVVKIDYEVVTRGPDRIKRPARLNIVRSGKIIAVQALRDPVSYQLLEGQL